MTPDQIASPLADQAQDLLRADILACRLLPGATLSELALTTRIGLGRAPVRAALARLAEEGLVEAIPRRGWVVTVITMRDIHEVFDLRLILEAEAARRAAEAVRGGAVDPDRLRALHELAEMPHGVAAMRRLHVGVAEIGGNRRLARQVGRLIDESVRMMALGRPHGARAAAEHSNRALLAALSEGDGPEAAAIRCEAIAAERAEVLAALSGPASPLVVSPRG